MATAFPITQEAYPLAVTSPAERKYKQQNEYCRLLGHTFTGDPLGNEDKKSSSCK